MAAPIAMDDIRNLPALLMACVRAKTWNTPEAAKIRILARVTRAAMDLSSEPWAPLTLLAGQASADLPVPNTDWTPEMHTIHNMIWPYIASSMGMRPCVAQLAGVVRIRDVDHAIELMQAYLADRRTIIQISETEAHTILCNELERAKPLYPELQLSFGYIGNLWWGPYRDDRSFRYFTQLAWHDNRASVCFGDCSLEGLSELAFKVQNGALIDFCENAMKQLESGKFIKRSCSTTRLAA